MNKLCLSDKIEKSVINIPTWSVGLSSMIERPVFQQLESQGQYIEKLEVDTITIDKYCQDNNVKCIDFIKIDVEGAEYRVLKGAENMLKKRLIKSGIFETGETLTDAKVSEKQLMEYLEEYGYILQKIPNNCIFWC